MPMLRFSSSAWPIGEDHCAARPARSTATRSAVADPRRCGCVRGWSSSVSGCLLTVVGGHVSWVLLPFPVSCVWLDVQMGRPPLSQ